MLLNFIRPINLTGKPDDFWHRPTMAHYASWLLALGAIVVVFSTSNAWLWRRRRRSCSAVNCRVSRLSSWSSCSRTCGSGVKTRTRTKTRSASCGGSYPYDFTDTKNATLTVVRWIVYSLGALGARVRDVECRAILDHQPYTDTVCAMETLVPPSRPGLVIPMCKYTQKPYGFLVYNIALLDKLRLF